MDLEQQMIFLFSALGGANGLLLSGYFLLVKSDKRLSDYFLGALILMLSIRTIKSVFLHFNGHLFEPFIQVGLAACFLIGPFLYLYIKSLTDPDTQLKRRWWWHILPYLVAILLFGYFFSYYDQRPRWRWFIEIIYKQWLLYILLSAYLLRSVFLKIGRRKKIETHEFWAINIWGGTFGVWLAYETSYYTSYIVGALSFSFIIYTTALLWIFKRTKKEIANDPPLRYGSSSLTDEDILAYKDQLDQFIRQEKPFLDPNLKLDTLSDQLGISSKVLSQVINQSFGMNYSQYIADLRVEESKKLLHSAEHAHFKISAIAYESGFNSLSSFNTYFKRIVGMTAKEYRESRS